MQFSFGGVFMPNNPKKRRPRDRKRATKRQHKQDYQGMKKNSVATGRETEDSKKKPGRAGKTQGPAVIPGKDSAG